MFSNCSKCSSSSRLSVFPQSTANCIHCLKYSSSARKSNSSSHSLTVCFSEVSPHLVGCRISKEEVVAGIEEAIDYGWNNPNPEIHAKWVAMSPTGSRPTVEQTILYLSAYTATEMKMAQERQQKSPWLIPQ